MVFRRQGILLPLERSILDVALAHDPVGVYGFALAQELAGGAKADRLIAHGTLYKALDRMRRAGLLAATWEDGDAAAAEGRPRRRTYRVTAQGVHALATGGLETPPRRHLGPAPA